MAARAESALAAYRRKRDFSATAEPRGRPARAHGNRFIVQKHDATRLHYDFRLELDGVLKSWAVTRGPSLDPADKRLAVRTEDHPLDYADFEGTIAKGNYGAGTVLLWDRGTWEPIDEPRQGLEHGKLSFRLNGEKLRGEWTLVRMHGARRGDRGRENWLLIKADDAAADREHDILAQAGASVASGRDLKDIAAGAPAKVGRARKTRRADGHGLPDFVEPTLATLVDEVPQGHDWLFEVKFDGYRALAAADGGNARIYTRNGLDWTDRFAPIAQALRRLDLDGVLLDGEIVVVDAEGRSDFGALQGALDGESQNLSYFVFDLLAQRREPITALPLRERKARLETLLSEGSGPVHYSAHVEAAGKAMLTSLCSKGFEGIVAKRADAPYRAGRSQDWLKIKCGHRQEFVIAGTSPSDRGRPFASLLLGVREGKALRYAGRVGSGFSQDLLERLAVRFHPLQRKTRPFTPKLTGPIARGATWLKPELVAEVAFAGFTRDRLVRQGRFIALREDKAASEIEIEEAKAMDDVVAGKPAAESHGTAASKGEARRSAAAAPAVRLTHRTKLLYPVEGLTKEDVANYLQAVAAEMLPFVERRPVSLVRCPDGRQKYCFFQRHPSAHMPAGFKPAAVPDNDGTSADYLTLEGVEGIVGCAQIGALEIHGWGARVDDIEHPDRLVFDLDPAPDVAFEAVKTAASTMREALEALNLKSFALLTGGKGIHVVVPLEPRHEWPVVKRFARAMAEHFVEHEPARYVAAMSKAKRNGKIFIDHFRNERSASAVMPYSPRARGGAPLAWPVEWSDLASIDRADAVTIATYSDRLGSKPWRGYFEAKQALSEAALQALHVEA